MIPQNTVHKALREVILPVGLLVIIARVRVIGRPVQKQHKQLLRRQIGGRIERESIVHKRDLRAEQNA